jgi:hypothetical protein
MAGRMLKVEIVRVVTAPRVAAVLVPGAYLATEIRDPPGATAQLPVPSWRLRRLDSEGRPLAAGPAFVLSFPELAELIEARRMRIVEGDFV